MERPNFDFNFNFDCTSDCQKEVGEMCGTEPVPEECMRAGQAIQSLKLLLYFSIFHFTVTTVSNENFIEKALCLLPGSKFPALLVP